MRDPLRHLTGYALRRVSTVAMEGAAQAVAPHGLRVSEISVMMVIDANPGSTLSEIGRLLNIQRANMTPLIARLGERGWVTRTPVDGRSISLDLTTEGRKTTRRAADALEAFEDNLLAQIAPADRPAFFRAIEAIWSASPAANTAPDK